MQRANTPPRTATGAVTPFIQIAGKGFDAERAARAVPVVDTAEHEPHAFVSTGSMARRFLGFAPRCSAATMAYP